MNTSPSILISSATRSIVLEYKKLYLSLLLKSTSTVLLKSAKQRIKPVDSIERKILLISGPVVFLSTCSSKHICNKMEFEIVAKKLQNLKLGVYGKKNLM